MHGGSFRKKELPRYARALRENEFAFRGMARPRVSQGCANVTLKPLHRARSSGQIAS